MQKTSNQKSKKKKHELSFTKKCIIISNIQNVPDKIFFNTFKFIPAFNYTTIKGGLFLFKDKNTLEKISTQGLLNKKVFSQI